MNHRQPEGADMEQAKKDKVAQMFASNKSDILGHLDKQTLLGAVMSYSPEKVRSCMCAVWNYASG